MFGELVGLFGQPLRKVGSFQSKSRRRGEQIRSDRGVESPVSLVRRCFPPIRFVLAYIRDAVAQIGYLVSLVGYLVSLVGYLVSLVGYLVSLAGPTKGDLRSLPACGGTSPLGSGTGGGGQGTISLSYDPFQRGTRAAFVLLVGLLRIVLRVHHEIIVALQGGCLHRISAVVLDRAGVERNRLGEIGAARAWDAKANRYRRWCNLVRPGWPIPGPGVRGEPIAMQPEADAPARDRIRSCAIRKDRQTRSSLPVGLSACWAKMKATTRTIIASMVPSSHRPETSVNTLDAGGSSQHVSQQVPRMASPHIANNRNWVAQ